MLLISYYFYKENSFKILKKLVTWTALTVTSIALSPSMARHAKLLELLRKYHIFLLFYFLVKLGEGFIWPCIIPSVGSKNSHNN